MEHLDHRQLLSVNFTGNVATDFPATTTPGVVVLTDPNNQQPVITDPALAQLVKVSGFAVSDVRVSYDPTDDTLSVGLNAPPSQQPTHPGPVIAGDSDNNGNDGTVDPAVLALQPGFRDYVDFGGSEFMGAFLDLKGSGSADVMAGYAGDDPRSPKQYQVALHDVNTGPTQFGQRLPQYEGNVYKVNSPQHPNLEFSIAHFSQLYLQETGQPLTPNSTIRLGAFGGSGEDTGIGEEFFHEQPFTLAQATVPPHTCPPASPPVIINPHSNRHINTAHPDLIRVNVLGSSGFDVSKIDPASVTLGGAHPVFSFDRFINRDEWPDATFVFKGTDVTLPRGFTEATVSGNLTDGSTFSSSVEVFNRDRSFYTPAQNLAQQQREAARQAQANGFVVLPPGSPVAAAGAPVTAASVAVTPAATAPTPAPARAAHPTPVVSIPTRETAAGQPQAPRLSGKIQSSINRFVRDAGAVNLSTQTPVGNTPAPAPRVSPKLQASINRFVRDTGAVNLSTQTPVGGGAL